MHVLNASQVSETLALFNCACGSGEQAFSIVLHGRETVFACNACETFTECDTCREISLESNAVEFDGDSLCLPCANESTAVCDTCSDRIAKDESAEIDGEIYCEGCRDENAIYCERCDEYSTATDNAGEVTTVRPGTYRRVSQVWCGDCFDSRAYHCDSCEDNFDETYRSQYTHDGQTFCENCFSESFVDCDNCGTTIDSDDAMHTDDYTYCARCYGSRRGRDWRNRLSHECALRKHGYKATDTETLDSSITGKALLFLGVELELEFDGTDGDAALDTAEEVFPKFATFKSDGSLEDGVEINTPPATFDFHTKAFNWKRALKALGASGWAAESSCGLHVHISRNAISSAALKLMAEFVYNPLNNSFIKAIAGRESETYAPYTGVKASDAVNGRTGRYVALNFQPSATIEFRLFAATLDQSTFLARLEFCQALSEFCETLAREANTLEDTPDAPTFEQFAPFVLENGERFPNLLNVCGPVQADRNARLAKLDETRAELERKRIGQLARVSEVDELSYSELLDRVRAIRSRTSGGCSCGSCFNSFVRYGPTPGYVPDRILPFLLENGETEDNARSLREAYRVALERETVSAASVAVF